MTARHYTEISLRHDTINNLGILEENVLDTKIEFTLSETFGIAKKSFRELIIDVIKTKIQMTAETMMMETRNEDQRWICSLNGSIQIQLPFDNE